MLDPVALIPASLLRRLASMAYDALLVTALLLVATFPFVRLTGGAVSPVTSTALQLYLLLICAAYFLWFWRHGGQTLAMKTWHIRLVTSEGKAPPLRHLLLRFCVALLGIAGAGVGLIWALWDRDHQFLHDRIARTRLIHVFPVSRVPRASHSPRDA